MEFAENPNKSKQSKSLSSMNKMLYFVIMFLVSSTYAFSSSMYENSYIEGLSTNTTKLSNGNLESNNLFVYDRNVTSNSFGEKLKTVETTSPGDLCTDPIVAIIGENEIDLSKGDKWMTYTPASDGILTITAANDPYRTWMETYSDCTEFSDSFYDRLQVLHVSANKVYYFKAKAGGVMKLNVNFSFRTPKTGDLCSDPLSAVLGNNSFDTEIGDKWFTYTPAKGGVLTLDTPVKITGTTISVYENCNSFSSLSSLASDKVSVLVSANETYYIKVKSDQKTPFSFLLSTRDLVAGDICSTALTAKLGTNRIDVSLGNKWMKYVPAKDEMLTIKSSTKYEGNWMAHFSDCNSDYANSRISTQEYNLPVSANTEYYFYSSVGSTDALIFDISSRELETGDVCTDPIVSKVGKNTIDLSKGDKWIAYTPTKDEMFTIESVNALSDYWLFSYNSCNNNYPESAFYEKKYSFPVVANQQYLFKVPARTSKPRSINLSIRDFEPGDLCSTAIAVQKGEIESDLSTGGKWFKYTATDDEKIRVAFKNEEKILYMPTRIMYYSNCGGGLVESTSEFTKSILINAIAGEEYFFKVEGGKTMKWLLKSIPVNQQGDNCTNPLLAKERNTTDFTTGDKWYKYIAPSDGMVEMRSFGYSSVRMNIYIDCQSEKIHKFYSINSYWEVKAGQVYYIHFLTRNTHSLAKVDWLLNFRKAKPAFSCSDPVPVTMDTEVKTNLSEGEKWYSFTAEEDGEFVALRSGSEVLETSISLYSDCDNYLISDHGSGLFFPVTAGEKYIISWKRFDYSIQEELTWSYTITDSRAGNLCSSAIEVEEGKHKSNTTIGEVWHKFIASKSGIAKIETVSGYFPSLSSVYGGCNGNKIKGFFGGNGSFEVIEGNDYYIHYSSGYNFEWELSIKDYEEGDTCEDPIEVSLGNFTALTSTGDKWFSYTANKSGLLKVQKVKNLNEGYVEIKSTCTDELQMGREKTTTTVEAGKTYLILWEYGKYDTEWNLEFRDPEEGELCENTLVATDGLNNLSVNKYRKLYTYTATSSGLLTVKAIDVFDAKLNLRADCYSSTFISSDEGWVSFKVHQGDNFVIEWTSDEVIAGQKFQISIRTIEQGDLIGNAFEVASEGAQTSNLSTGGKWFAYKPLHAGVLEISSAAVNKDLLVGIVGENRVYWNNYNDNTHEPQNESVFYIENIPKYKINKGLIYYIYIEDKNKSKALAWNLKLRDYRAGELPSKPKEAILGDNTLDSPGFLYAWYSFVPNKTGEVTFSMDNILGNPWMQLIDQERKYFTTEDNAYSMQVVKGETYNFTVAFTDRKNGLTWKLSGLENKIPTASRSLEDITVDENFSSSTVDLSGLFTDADGDAITLSAGSSNTNVVRVNITDNKLVISEVRFGSSEITVTANDNDGGTISETFTFTVRNTTALENVREFEIKLYPNPSDGKFTIEHRQGAVQLQIINSAGLVVIDKQTTNGLIPVDISSQQKGIYFIRLKTANKVTVQKIIIE